MVRFTNDNRRVDVIHHSLTSSRGAGRVSLFWVGRVLPATKDLPSGKQKRAPVADGGFLAPRCIPEAERMTPLETTTRGWI